MGRRMTPLRVCLLLSSLEYEQYDTIWRYMDLFMHQTCAIPFIIKQNICQQWNRESWTVYPPSASCTKMCPPCTTSMYINIIQCAKRYHPWNVSTISLYQHVNMCIYQYANHVHPPICQPCASTNMPNNVSYRSWYVSIMNQVPQSCISNKFQLLCLSSSTNGLVSSSIFHLWVYQTCTLP